MNNLPKSLHTVSVLVAVARAIPVTMPIDQLGTRAEYEARVNQALRVLGYGDLTADMYGLATKAAAQLLKGAK